MKVLAGLAAAMVVLLIVGILAAAQVIDLPGSWRTTLGFNKSTPNPPCRLGLYRNSPAKPPPPPGHWRLEPETPRNQIEASAIAIGKTIYVVGGAPPGNLHRLVAYNTQTHEFSDPTRLPTGLNHVQAATHDGKLYLAGGYLNGENPTSNFWQWDPKANKWTQLPPLPQPTAAGSSVVVGDKLYVAGGAPQTFNVPPPIAPYADLQIYDFETERWSFGPEMPDPRHHTGGATVDGMLYVAGGRGEEDHSLSTFERYDPATDEWKSMAELPLGVASPGLVAVDGKLVIVGGEDQKDWEEGKGWVTPSAWQYDPRTNRWSRLPDMKHERRGGGVAAVGNRVYAIGGSYCPGLKPNGPVGTHTVESLDVARYGSG
jgi:N-acetylneuraminic acid mutarotase